MLINAIANSLLAYIPTTVQYIALKQQPSK